MARKKDIQYVRFYTAGAAAPRVTVPKEKPVVNHPAKAPVKRIPLPFDPVAVIGTTVAVVMLVCVLIGFVQYNQVSRQVQEMETYISYLKAENTILQSEYQHGYNLEEMRQAALSMGMIPVEEAQHIYVPAPEAEPVEEPTWWETLWTNLRGLFA